ncbi:ScbR family autoregulator-binding transcription factor [Streptomyces albidoflavus]|uniref:ScbR family autoregulator-binding transcription factor n=1 Tax=Streptomyces TaxID=1883 RepID=UPI0010104012|nr:MULTISPECIES: ScbR family autoregulator-binding transcription factor [Streptomyces]MCU7707009.1 TetR/AcrR family transcriptional regulator [Streptomyces albidoflavus]
MPEPKQERAQRTREEILRAAAEVFDERGYSGASMREIMNRARVTLGAVYFHFPNKEALALAVMRAQPSSIVPALKSRGLQRLVDITFVWAHKLQTDPTLRAGVRLTSEQTGFGLDDATPYREWARIMEECLADGRAAGEIRENVDIRSTAEFLVSACTGLQAYSLLTSGREDLPDRTRAMWRLLIPTIACDAASVDVSEAREAAVNA